MNRISRILVANRAEIASRIFRSARGMGISTVAVYSDADDALPYLAEADVAVRLPGRHPRDTYLDGPTLIEAALRSGADAIHPGYGFLSENATFAQAVLDAGLTFIGPAPTSIEVMGSKIHAKRLMAEAGVPVLPQLIVAENGSLGTLPAGMPYPLLVKASAGGGGRGMRVAREEGELPEVVHAAQQEALSAFGDPTVFIEPLIDRPRHIEVQVIGDAHGNTVHLFERECSLQRRFQKVVEESPSPSINDTTRASMLEAAVQAARSIDYLGVGTVEFVVDPNGGFYFLEMNTRLQVEHPVTEEVTGIDLVEAQIRVARGERLSRELLEARSVGHAIEVRLYAEDTAAEFRPDAGTLALVDIPASEGIRLEMGFTSGTTVSTYYDAMLGKIIATGTDRAQAIDRLRTCIASTRVAGVSTNLGLLQSVLSSEEFRDGTVDTGFLTRALSRLNATSTANSKNRVQLLLAAALHRADRQRRSRAVLRTLPTSWRNTGPSFTVSTFVERGDKEITVRFTQQPELSLCIDEHDLGTVGVEEPPVVDADSVLLVVEGVRHRIPIFVGDRHVLVGRGPEALWLEERERFTVPTTEVEGGSLTSPMPAGVVEVRVEVGEDVERGTVVVVVEAMKMRHEICAPFSGTVRTINVHAGDQVDSGALLAVIDEHREEERDGG